MKQLEKCLKSRQGTTLVEMLVTLTLITIMVGMAATTLSAAFKIFLRVQKEQYAQSVLDTTMTELRSLTKEATQYVKIYGNDASPEGRGERTVVRFWNMSIPTDMQFWSVREAAKPPICTRERR